MASELSNDEKMVMARELSGDDSHTASFHRKRTAQGDSAGDPPTSPTKRHKKLVGEQEVHDLVPQGESLPKEDGDLGSNAAEGEPRTMEESLKGRDGRGNADGTTGNQEEIHAAKVAPVAKATDTAHLRRVADEFHGLTRILSDSLERLEGRNKKDLEKALSRAEALELMCCPRGSYQLAPLSDIVQNRSRLSADATQIGKNERDSDAPSSSTSTSDDDTIWLELDAPASVSQRQKDDPELREKIHKVETDYWEKGISRKVYNEERFKLYTEEEAKEARIAWPRKEHEKCYSPAGFREALFDQYDLTEDGPDWQTRMDFHCPRALSHTDTGEENLGELCIPLIEKKRDFLKAQRRRMEELEAMREEWEKEPTNSWEGCVIQGKKIFSWEEMQAKWLSKRKEKEKKEVKKEKKVQEKALEKNNGPPCPVCKKKFATESALKNHTKVKHRKGR